MDKLPVGIDREVTDGLATDEMAELLIAYAQGYEELRTENERLQQQVRSLTRSNASRLQYIRSVRDAEAAIRRFCADPAIAPYIPSLDEVMARIFGDPTPYGGEAT